MAFESRDYVNEESRGLRVAEQTDRDRLDKITSQLGNLPLTARLLAVVGIGRAAGHLVEMQRLKAKIQERRRMFGDFD